MINHIKDQDFVKFKDAVQKSLDNKIQNHPSLRKQNDEITKIQNMKSLFKQINKL